MSNARIVGCFRTKRRVGNLSFFKRNAFDDLFAINDQDPVRWRFVIERASSDEGEDQVHFVGYKVYSE